MRVLRVDNLKFEEFHSLPDDDYAILSHVWGEKEISYMDLQGVDHSKHFCVEGKEDASAKLLGCRERARKAGIKYFWIDTCCIDKSNHSELSEAINSMFDWYSRSRVCYAYLADAKSREDFAASKWFSRGWTLQELLAPKSVIFFGRDWNMIGATTHLGSIISTITHIPLDFLVSRRPLEQASIAQRMSWISGRSTSKTEDLAYCLFGIFDVHMPLLYGEGLSAAFRRLQFEILKIDDDTSIFAWNPQMHHNRLGAFGLLAHTPALFKESHDVVCARLPVVTGHTNGIRTPITWNNKGLHLSLPVLIEPGRRRLAILGCTKDGMTDSRYAIRLYDISTNDGRYVRVGPLATHSIATLDDAMHFEHLTTELKFFKYREYATVEAMSRNRSDNSGDRRTKRQRTD